MSRVLHFDNLVERSYVSKGEKVSINTTKSSHVPFQQKNAKCQTAFRTRSTIRALSSDFGNQLLGM